MFGWRAEESAEHVVCGSRGSANEIISVSRRRKHQKHGVNRTCGVGTTAVRGLESIRSEAKWPE